MKPLTLLPGKNAVTALNAVLDTAYTRASAPGRTKDEPHFVRELISAKTINELNTAASNTYDENINSVRFAGGFIHGSPLAEFNAINNGVSTSCTRELADAVVILNETAPDSSGIHRVIRRSACLLMFKTKVAAHPKCPRYDANGATAPKGSDQEQFHLFSAWPPFNLLGNGIPSGPYSIGKSPNSADRHSHGKYGILWSPSSKKTCGWGHHWRYADPVPKGVVSDSLGLLLSRMVDADSNSGREYQLTGGGHWDKLIVNLQAYAVCHQWDGASRSANPANLSFIQVRDTIDTNLGTIAQHIRTSVMQNWQKPNFHILDQLNQLAWMLPHLWRGNNFYTELPDDALPVLNITVSSFRPLENSELIDPRSRLRLMDRAISGLEALFRRDN